MRTPQVSILLAAAVSLASLTMALNAAAAQIDPGKTIDLPPPTETYKPPPPQFAPPTADGFYWSAAPRAQKWVDAWRAAALPEDGRTVCDVDGYCRKIQQYYSPDYINPKSFDILVEGCVDKADWDLDQAGKSTKRAYTWTANGQAVAVNKCRSKLTFPAQGSYPVSLGVDGKTFKQIVRVKDILIVAIGDSMSSGEGSPDYMQFNGTPYRGAGWVDRQCHRSKSAPAAQAAMAIERMDPKTSVTFISFACSGATLDTNSVLSTSMWDGYAPVPSYNKYWMSGTGILGPYVGIESPHGEDYEDIIEYLEEGGHGIQLSQVDQLKLALSGARRRADVVVMSAGINDARFAAMMHTCALYSDCPEEGIGSAGSKMPLKNRFAWDADKITDMYKRLGQEIGPLANRVMVFQYPNAFTGDNGKTCEESLEDVALAWLPGVLRLGVTAYEADWIQSFAGPRVHSAIKQGTSLAGFEFIEGPWQAFKGHGYCASQQNRWMNRATDSNVNQGPSLGDTKGTIHPNQEGYRQLSMFILKELVGQENNSPPRPLSDLYNAARGRLLKVDVTGGVLANDSDSDITGTLTVKSYTQPDAGPGVDAGKVQVEPDGSFVYNPAGFAGKASFFYTVTDGVGERIGRVLMTVTATETVPTRPTININALPLAPKPVTASPATSAPPMPKL